LLTTSPVKTLAITSTSAPKISPMADSYRSKR
jgi:hypothetical protein